MAEHRKDLLGGVTVILAKRAPGDSEPIVVRIERTEIVRQDVWQHRYRTIDQIYGRRALNSLLIDLGPRRDIE